MIEGRRGGGRVTEHDGRIKDIKARMTWNTAISFGEDVLLTDCSTV